MHTVAKPAGFLQDLSLSAVVAGFVTVLVGFTSSAAIVIQAAQTLGAGAQEIGAWMLALGMGMGITCIGLSLHYRTPLATAWSTSGAAMLVAGGAGTSMGEAVAAFLVAAALIVVAGFSGWFEKLMKHLPMPIASGMLAGLLLRFGVEAFGAVRSAPLLVLTMFAAYLAARRLVPRYAVIAALLAGAGLGHALGLLRLEGFALQLAVPVFTPPEFKLATVLGLGLPLFVVTMTSQNMSGIAAIRASGYQVPVSPLIGWTGAATFLLAPFGAYALNLAAITAAISMGREAHEDPAKRYVAAVFAGVFYILVGSFGATVVAAFAALPPELVLCIAGIALLGTIGNSLFLAMSEEHEREPALIAFLVSLSGLTLFGIGAAFWGLVAGVIARLVLRRRAGRVMRVR